MPLIPYITNGSSIIGEHPINDIIDALATAAGDRTGAGYSLSNNDAVHLKRLLDAYTANPLILFAQGYSFVTLAQGVTPGAGQIGLTAPGGALAAGVSATVTVAPVPRGVNGADVGHIVTITGGTGTPEDVTVTGGTAVSGASSGTLTFTPANNHSDAWRIQSASAGYQEATRDLPATGGLIVLPAALNEEGRNASFPSDSLARNLNQGARTNFQLHTEPNIVGTPNVNGNYAQMILVQPGPDCGGNLVGLYIAIETGEKAGPDHADIWAFNTVCNWRAGDPDVNLIGYELDINNLNGDTFSALKHGIAVVNGYYYKTGTGISVGTILPGLTGLWRNAAVFQDFSDYGVIIGGPHAGAFLPSATPINLYSQQDTNGSDNIVLRRATNSAPTGYFVRMVNGDNSANIVLWDIDGNLTLPSITTTGYVASQSIGVTLSNGANDNVNIGAAGFIRIGGPTGSYNITGFTGGVDGRELDLFNVTVQTLTLKHLTGSATGNQIFNPTGTDAVLCTGLSVARLRFSGPDNAWILMSYST